MQSKKFVYNSGGRWFPNPFGEWNVIVEDNGLVVSTNYQGNNVKFEKKFNLKEEENHNLWDLVEKSNIAMIKPHRTIGVPEEATHTFKIIEKDSSLELQVLNNELYDFPTLQNIKEYLKLLLKKYTKKNVVF